MCVGVNFTPNLSLDPLKPSLGVKLQKQLPRGGEPKFQVSGGGGSSTPSVTLMLLQKAPQGPRWSGVKVANLPP